MILVKQIKLLNSFSRLARRHSNICEKAGVYQEEAAEQLKIIFENAQAFEYNSEWAGYKSKADLILIPGKDNKEYLE